MPSILFLCVANRSRSPVAAACFRKHLAGRHMLEGWSVSSAGTWATDGLPATPDALSYAKRASIDLGKHASSSITASMLHAADLVIVMERGQKEALRSEFAEDAGKVHTLTELAGEEPYDVPDPAVSAVPAEIYGEIADLIGRAFDRILLAVAR
jgi:protein-tyrosine phosphatase